MLYEVITHATGIEGQLITCLWITATAGFFILDIEFPESTQKQILTGDERGFRQGKKGLNRIGGLGFRS